MYITEFAIGVSGVRVCPGVCVAERISQYCEAALDVAQLCHSDLRCCVSGDLFDDVDNPPKEFVLLNPKKKDEVMLRGIEFN